MSLTLKEMNAVRALARAMESFLPGSAARQWKGHVNFGTVANDVGVGDYWDRDGSKEVRLAHLFERTLRHRSSCFEPLIMAIVKEGLTYRSKRGNRITAEEIKVINGHIVDIGFKFPHLWDRQFLDALAVDDEVRARSNVENAQREIELRSSTKETQLRALGELRVELEEHFKEGDRQAAGFRLEGLLNRLFRLFQLDPRRPFKLVGEQIDGSFVLDHEVYLLEAKWEKDALDVEPLLVFREKTTGKSNATRGVFLAMNDITREAEVSIRQGRQPNFFLMTGYDLMMILQGALPLDDFLRSRQRILAEEGIIKATFDRVRT